jgi:glycosyltransferase involved in cell wall biosynthesis
MRRLRILHTESSQGWGGQEIRILTEAAGMMARGHAVTLLSCPESRIERAARIHGIPVVPLPIQRKRPAALGAMRAWLAAHGEGLDVVNTHSSTDAWLVALAAATLRAAPPVVRTRHVSTTIGNNPATRWLYRDATRHIVTTGERLRRQLHDDNGIALEHVTSVPTGIDLARYRPGDRASARVGLGLADRPSAGIVATLRSWKGHQDLLTAWHALGSARGCWQLVVVGDGPQRTAIEARVRELTLGDSVVLAGNRDDVERWLQALDLFVLPSYGNEGVPQGIMQAMDRDSRRAARRHGAKVRARAPHARHDP